MAFAPSFAALREEISGVPTILTGDSLELRGHRVRLFGIDAPEQGQVCRVRGKNFDCGKVAASALMDLTAGITIRCLPRQRAEDAVVAICYADGYDLSEGMTYTEWALALPDEGSRYKGLEEEARMAQRGLWRGDFVAPWNWRKGERLAGTE